LTGYEKAAYKPFAMPEAKPEFVVYNGVKMAADWPERIQEAQTLLTISIGGREYSRIPYGQEADDWGAERGPCHDCAVTKGQLHVPGCDVEQCPLCLGQSLSCECPYDDDSE
jgi:hypothetical protein